MFGRRRAVRRACRRLRCGVFDVVGFRLPGSGIPRRRRRSSGNMAHIVNGAASGNSLPAPVVAGFAGSASARSDMLAADWSGRNETVFTFFGLSAQLADTVCTFLGMSDVLSRCLGRSPSTAADAGCSALDLRKVTRHGCQRGDQAHGDRETPGHRERKFRRWRRILDLDRLDWRHALRGCRIRIFAAFAPAQPFQDRPNRRLAARRTNVWRGISRDVESIFPLIQIQSTHTNLHPPS